MKVLITGATGFVGRALLAELTARGLTCIAVGGPGNTESHYSIDVGDVEQVRQLASIGNVEAIVHAAGIAHRSGGVSDGDFDRVNVAGVENVARLAVDLNAKHFLLLSSTLVYGRRSDPEAMIDEDDECKPADAYGKSKLAGEEAARRVCESDGLPLTIFRPAPIMGEGSKGNFARLIRAIESGRFVWVGSGDNLKSVVYVGDVAQAAAIVLDSPNRTQIFNLAADAVRMKDIVNAIADALGRGRPSVHLPARPIEFAAKAAGVLGAKFKRITTTLETWLGNDVYSNERLHDAYGWTPATPLDIAVSREVGYYLNHK